MKIFDVSQTISERLQTYPGDPATIVERVLDVARGDPYSLSSLSMSAHTGTHIDAPSHLIQGGKSIEEVALDVMIGPANLVSIESEGRITRSDLENASILTDAPRLLIKTQKHSRFEGAQTYLSDDAARWIVESGIKLIGIDSISIDSPYDNSLTVHRTLLESNVVILESLDLSEVPPGNYTLICLPLKIENGDGAPARVVLVRDFG